MGVFLLLNHITKPNYTEMFDTMTELVYFIIL